MAYSFVFRENALKEFTDAFVWYEQQQDGLGQLFRKRIYNKLEKICIHPFHYRQSYKHFHEAVVDKFPFLIVYSVDQEIKSIVIFAVFHTRRNPKKKFKRS